MADNAPGEAGSRLTQGLFRGVAFMAALVVLLPLILGPVTPSFAGKWLGASIFIAVGVERIWSMYLRQGLAMANGGGRDWTAVAVGYSYALTLGWAVAEFYWRRSFPSHVAVALGGLAYGAGVALRYWAFHTLRHQWHVDVSDIEGERHLVRSGPYRWIRHPLYLGACMEIVGVPAFLGGWGALVFGAAVFVPLEVVRAYYEERFLLALFGHDYLTYKREVWGFIPLPWPPASRR